MRTFRQFAPDTKLSGRETGAVIKKVFSYLKPYSLRIALVLICGVISAVFTLFSPLVVGKVTTTLFKGIADSTFYWDRIKSLLTQIIIIYVIAKSFLYMQNFHMARITADVMKSLRKDIDAKMHRLKLSYYDSRTHGDILSVITNDVDTLNNTLSHNLTEIVTRVISGFGVTFMMLRISPLLTLIPIVMVPLSFFGATHIMKKAGKHFALQQKLLGKLNGHIEEMYNGREVVQSFAYEKRAGEAFDALNTDLKNAAIKAETISGSVNPVTTFINNTGFALCAAAGCARSIAGKMEIGEVQAMLDYIRNFARIFQALAGMSSSFGAAFAAANRIFSLLDVDEEIPDSVNPAVPKSREGRVEFKDVKFGYSKDRPLMKGVSFSAEPGQQIAIVGPTGAGKTTLINLLMRFYEPDSGAIYVDGTDIRDMTRAELRNRIGMVLQDTWLFEGTIERNIGFAEDNMSTEKILSASKSARAHNFIETLPGGYGMVLNKGAENISQGERQLLTIARAIASDPEIMILDEATSNVDTHTEVLIQKAMAELLKGRTSFIIAHRLSTIRDADIIFYMEDGDIKEAGNHNELMAFNGKYARLYNSQFA